METELDAIFGIAETPTRSLPAENHFLYFDIETVPDWGAASAIGIKKVEIPEPTPVDKLPEPTTEGSEADVKERFASVVEPPSEWMEKVRRSEQRRKPKPRKGVSEFLDKLGEGSTAHAELESQRKKLATHPETLKIVSIAWAMDEGEAVCHSVNETPEKEILRLFWSQARLCESLVGFHCIGFDLPAIFVRSIVLDVEPTRRFSTKPWDDEVIDLHKRRHGNNWPSVSSKLKDVAKLFDLNVMADDTSGGDVERMVEHGKWEELRHYNVSDVVLTRDLHKKYMGFFC